MVSKTHHKRASQMDSNLFFFPFETSIIYASNEFYYIYIYRKTNHQLGTLWCLYVGMLVFTWDWVLVKGTVQRSSSHEEDSVKQPPVLSINLRSRASLQWFVSCIWSSPPKLINRSPYHLPKNKLLLSLPSLSRLQHALLKTKHSR